MDVVALRERVKNTLDANSAIRQAAELDLRHVGARAGACIHQHTDSCRPKSSPASPTPC